MAEQLETCGCLSLEDLKGVRGITYCELHKAAPEMLAALEGVLLNGTHEGQCDNIGLERDEACELHVQASADRRTRAREARDMALALPARSTGD